MQERKHASSRTRRRPVAAFVAVLLAFALAFMAFEPNTLRSAFATNGEAATADADAQENGDLQATEPAEDELEEDGADEGDDDAATGEASAVEGDAPAEEEAVAEDPVAVTDEGEGGDDARAGPSGETDLSGESPNTAEAEVEAKAERAFKTRTASASCTVTFYSNVASESPSILARKLVTAEAGQTVQVVVGDVVASAPTGAEAFDGWLYGGETHTDSIEIDPQDGDVRLYPVFSSGHWLRFVEGDSGSDAVYVPSQFIGATEQVPAALPTTTREGYTFAGWFTGSISNGVISYGTRMTDENGMVLDSDSLRSMLRASDVVLYASWQAVETTYRVITLYQNPEGDGYSYQGSVTVGGDGSGEVISGEMTDVSQLPEVPGFTAKEIKQERIKGDGSTVVNAYYDRNMYKVVFHKERSDSSDLFHELTIEARYGADIHDKWPKPSATGEYSTSWYTLTDPNSNVFVTGIGTMPLGGAKYYRMENKGTECNTKFMIQNIDGTNNFTEYGSQPFSTTHSTATTADDYKPIKGFMVNAASEADMLAIQRIPAGDKAATYNADFKRSAAVGASYNNAPTTTDEGDVARHTL
ncbi:MAG: InlB B-repeat-containing protein [Eggerthellaceae bacterium]|nr:InlB B-repeat-containing protein [Eggerthellaceae bacterium]